MFSQTHPIQQAELHKGFLAFFRRLPLLRGIFFIFEMISIWQNEISQSKWMGICPLHVGISLRSALKGTLSFSLSVTLADETRKSPLIETHIRI